MPKGVYARKSAQPSATGRKKSAAGAAAKKGRTNKRKQDSKPVSNKAASTETAQALEQKTQRDSPPAPSIVAPEFKVAPAFHRQKSVPVDSLGGDELRHYARGLGISQRDVDGLSEDRLRQNCKARIFESMED